MATSRLASSPYPGLATVLPNFIARALEQLQRERETSFGDTVQAFHTWVEIPQTACNDSAASEYAAAPLTRAGKPYGWGTSAWSCRQGSLTMQWRQGLK